MASEPELLTLGDERFVSLTTFRSTGAGVSTPVWIAREHDALIVTTPETSGKVKRLRNDPRVELQPCNRFGKVEEGAEPVPGRAEIMAGEGVRTRLASIFRGKYGLEYRVFMAIEALTKRGSRNRVMVRIVPA